LQILPVPADAPEPDFTLKNLGKPATTWTYKSMSGDILGYVCRFETNEGKEIRPLTLWTNGWQWKGFEKPRPLFGLENLKPLSDIVIVEGEKSAEALQNVVPENTCVLTWPGGSNGHQHAKWGLLKARNIIIWPDADEPGFKAANEIKKILSDYNKITMFRPPKDSPKGWDAYDALQDRYDWPIILNMMRTEEPEPKKKNIKPLEADVALEFLHTKSFTTSSPGQIRSGQGIESLKLHYWRGDWWQWDGKKYRVYDQESMNGQVMDYLEQQKKLRAFSSISFRNTVIEHIKAKTMIEKSIEERS